MLIGRDKQEIDKAGLKSNVFDDTVPDPTDTVVLNGINFLEKFSISKFKYKYNH